MGSPLPEASWNTIEGAYYTGAGGTWEPIWLLVSIGLCVVALVLGIAHEKHAYHRIETERDD